ARQRVLDARARTRCDIASAVRDEVSRVLDDREKAVRPQLAYRGADGAEYDGSGYAEEERNADGVAGYGSDEYGEGYEQRNAPPWPQYPGPIPPSPQRRIVVGRPTVTATPPVQSWGAPPYGAPPAPSFGAPPPYAPPYGPPAYWQPYGDPNAGSYDPYGVAPYDPSAWYF